MNPRPLGIASWPGQSANPYFRLFYGALEPYGVCHRGELVVDAQWLHQSREEVQFLHFHWPELIWRRELSGRAARLGAMRRLWSYLALARKLGFQAIWTVHNLEPHEEASWIDRCGCTVLAHGCELLVCHSRHALEEARRTHWVPRKKLVHMPHGSYLGWFPTPRDRSKVLSELGLDPDRPTVSMVGQLRSYKGIDLALAAVAELPEVQLVVAGRSSLASDELSSLRNQLPGRLAVVERQLSDQEVADYLAACNLSILPYRQITGSGALWAALSMSRPVVASDLPYFREILAEEPAAGVHCRVGDAAALARGIQQILARPAEESNAAALRLAERYRWDRAVRPLVARLGLTPRIEPNCRVPE